MIKITIIIIASILTSCAPARFTHTHETKSQDRPQKEKVIVEVEIEVKKNYCYYDPWIDCDVCERRYYLEYYCYY